ncbi:MAG TPA: radical SAM protein [Desulfobacteria bacterium]|nr:radical SAM protein [Desulfobacteria bacterium]
MAARHHIIPIFLPHWGCPYHCVYCDQRTIAAKTGPTDIGQIIDHALTKVPPGAHPVEVAFYGGTFTALPLARQEQLLEQVRPFLASGRIDSIRLSTHPAWIYAESLQLLKDYNVETVELGVQSLDREVLQHSGRAYDPAVVEEAVHRLKQSALAVGIQLMPGLPGDTKSKFLRTVERTIKLRPTLVRVYPTVVIKGTRLAEMWIEGNYRALGLQEAVDWCKDAVTLFAAADIPIIRMGLQPSSELTESVLAGPYHPAFRALVDAALMLTKIEQALPEKTGNLIIYCHPRDISSVRGLRNANVDQLKGKYGFDKIQVLPALNIARGDVYIKQEFPTLRRI